MRLIFRHYLEGYSAKKISQYLEENGIKTATGQNKWYDSVIFKMLRNEKYMGDALLQKTYTVDFMTKKKVINKGIVHSIMWKMTMSQSYRRNYFIGCRKNWQDVHP